MDPTAVLLHSPQAHEVTKHPWVGGACSSDERAVRINLSEDEMAIINGTCIKHLFKGLAVLGSFQPHVTT